MAADTIENNRPTDASMTWITQTPAMETALDSWTVVARIFVGGIFLLAGVLKARRPRQLMHLMTLLLHTSSLLAAFLTGVVLSAEIGVGLLLFIGYRAPLAAILATLLLAVFTGTLIHLQRNGYDAGCGCFGGGRSGIGGVEILRNIVLLTLAVGVTVNFHSGAGNEYIWNESPSLIAAALAGLLGCGLLYWLLASAVAFRHSLRPARTDSKRHGAPAAGEGR